MCGIIGYEMEKGNKIIPHSQKFEDIPKIEPETMNILNFIKFENYYCQITPLFQQNLKDRIDNYSEVARKINVSPKTVNRILTLENYWINFQTLLNLSMLFKISSHEVYNNIQSIKTHNSFPISFNIKNLISPAFFRVIGHFLGDGGINVVKKEGKYRAFYVNNEQDLLDSFSEDINFLFKKIKIYSRKRDNHGDEIWLPTTVGYLFYQILNYDNLTEKRVPKFILDSNNQKLLGVFLQAFYDDEGSISPNKNMIVISQKSKNLLNDIRECIKKVGINPNQILVQKPKNRSMMYHFSITSKINILVFAKKIGFLHPTKKDKLNILVSKYRRK